MTNHIVLFEPLFPANTGNIARTCAGTDTVLHLIKPLGFSTDDKHMKRAGLDYWDKVKVVYHEDLLDFMATVPNLDQLYLVSKFAERDYTEVDYRLPGDHYFCLARKRPACRNRLCDAIRKTVFGFRKTTTTFVRLTFPTARRLLFMKRFVNKDFLN